MNVKELSELFREKGRTLGCVESLTGGLFAKTIVDVSGASHFFKGGLVTYANEEKARLLSISYDDIDKFGVVSPEISQQMAYHGQKILNTDYCISFTGNAGPVAMENKPVGRVYISVAVYNQVIVTTNDFSGTRDEIREQSVQAGIDLLAEAMKKFN